MLDFEEAENEYIHDLIKERAERDNGKRYTLKEVTDLILLQDDEVKFKIELTR